MKKESRHGKHQEDKVQFGGMVTPEFKALAQLTASMSHCSMMDLMIHGVHGIATGLGIMRNGQVAPEYADAITAMADIIRDGLARKRGTSKKESK